MDAKRQRLLKSVSVLEKQELSYRKQYVEGIYRPKCYTMTFKSLETESLDRSYTTYY